MSEEENSLKTIWEHIKDLRYLLIKISFFWIIGSLIGYFFSSQAIDFILKPISEKSLKVYFLSPEETFFLIVKFSFLLGFVFSLPFNLIVIWNYFKEIFNPKQQKIIKLIVVISLFLNCLGLFYGYYLILPRALDFFLSFKLANTSVFLSASKYFEFVNSFVFAIIIFFQIPVLVFCLIKANILNSQFFQQRRKQIYFSFLVAIMAFGSNDFVSLLFLFLPVTMLFEIALFLSNFPLNKNK